MSLINDPLWLSSYSSSEIHVGESIIKISDCKNSLGIKIDSKVHFWLSCSRSMQKSYHKITSLSSSNPLINSFLMHNVITVHWFGCFKAVTITRKLSIYLEDVCNLFKMTNSHLMKNSKKDWLASVHHSKIQSIAIEMFQIKHGQYREIVTDTFKQKQNFRKKRDFRTPSLDTPFHDSKSINAQNVGTLFQSK